GVRWAELCSGRWTRYGSRAGPRFAPWPPSPPPARTWRPGAVHARGPGLPDADRAGRAAEPGLPHASGAAAVAGAPAAAVAAGAAGSGWSTPPAPGAGPAQPRAGGGRGPPRWREGHTP